MDIRKKDEIATALSKVLIPKINSAAVTEDDGCTALSGKRSSKGFIFNVNMSLYSEIEAIEDFKPNAFDIGFDINFSGVNFNNITQKYEWNSDAFIIRYFTNNKNISWGYKDPVTGAVALSSKSAKVMQLDDDVAIAKSLWSTIIKKVDTPTLERFAKAVFAQCESTILRPHLVK